MTTIVIAADELNSPLSEVTAIRPVIKDRNPLMIANDESGTMMRFAINDPGEN